MVLMTLLAQVASVAQDSIMSLTEVTAESMNVWELAVKGGWIMIVLALLSIIGIYIFFERFSTLRNALKRNPLFMERIHDNIKDDDMKSASNYCRSENTPLSRIIEKGIKSFAFSASSIRETIDNSSCCSHDWFLGHGYRYGSRLLGDGQRRKQHRRVVVVGRYLRGNDYHSRWSCCRYHRNLCIQLSCYNGR